MQRTRVASAGVTTMAPSNAISSSAASIRPAPAFAPPARPEQRSFCAYAAFLAHCHTHTCAAPAEHMQVHSS